MNALKGNEPFEGALLWIRRWEIWSEQIDNAGVNLLELLMKGAGSSGGVAQNPSILFDASEFDVAYSIAALPLLLQWDAYVIPPHGRNESWVVLAKDAHEWNSIRQAFDHWERLNDASRYVSSVSEPQ